MGEVPNEDRARDAIAQRRFAGWARIRNVTTTWREADRDTKTSYLFDAALDLAALAAEVAERGPLPVGDELVLVPREPTEQMVEAIELLRLSRREHLYVEDCWYSCPKATDGCCDDSQGDACNCGADEWNARLDAFLAAAAALGVPRDEPVREGDEG